MKLLNKTEFTLNEEIGINEAGGVDVADVLKTIINLKKINNNGKKLIPLWIKYNQQKIQRSKRSFGKPKQSIIIITRAKANWRSNQKSNN